jgi:heme exporter protein A
MLEAIDLAARRGSSHLFSSLSFSVESGCAMFVTGANGTGKTTLLRILAGLGAPYAGTVRWRGVNVAPFAQSLRDDVACGHLPALKDELTAEENLAALVALTGESMALPSFAMRSPASRWNARPGFRRVRSPKGSVGA